ncbi:MAG: NAD(P)H-dependent oxidoreductase [Candidatus Woesearchaeota archaeon]
MKPLIVCANPHRNGHCKYILDVICEQVGDYELLDLYHEEFDPRLHESELYTIGNEASKQTKQLQNKVEQSPLLIFIYPVWWNSMPAMLKGYFDRVYSAGFAFEYKRIPVFNIHAPKPLLKGKQALIFTTMGAKHWMAPTILRNRFKKQIQSDIMRFCGIRSKIYSLYDCKQKTLEQRKPHIRQMVIRAIRTYLK